MAMTSVMSVVMESVKSEPREKERTRRRQGQEKRLCGLWKRTWLAPPSLDVTKGGRGAGQDPASVITAVGAGHAAPYDRGGGGAALVGA